MTGLFLRNVDIEYVFDRTFHPPLTRQRCLANHLFDIRRWHGSMQVDGGAGRKDSKDRTRQQQA